MKQYRKGIVPKMNEGQAGEENRSERIAKWASAFVFLLAALAIMRGVMLRLPGSITVSSSVNGQLLPISSVETEKKQVALTFDAVEGNGDTAQILETLKRHDVHATFFLTGGWVEAYPDEVKALLNAGHDLGNGSDSHRSMPQLTAEQCMEEIQQAHTKVQELTGYDMFLFRPPYGDYDNQVISSAAQSGYYSILWDVDSLDWKDYGIESILNNVLKSGNLQNGSIIRCQNGAKYTADALEKLIDGLEKQGYEIVPVSQLIYKEKYHWTGKGGRWGINKVRIIYHRVCVLGEQTYDCAVEVYSAGEESHARVNPTGKNLNGKKKENNRGRLLAGAACWRWDFSGQVNFRTQREKVIKSKFVLEEDRKKPMSMDLESGFPCSQNCQKNSKSVRIIKIRDQDADK